MNARPLFECYVAGLTHHEFEVGKDRLKRGDSISLHPEPKNPYDPEAIRIDFIKKGRRVILGYVPRIQTHQVRALVCHGPGEVSFVVWNFTPSNPAHRMIQIRGVLGDLKAVIADPAKQTRRLIL